LPGGRLQALSIAWDSRPKAQGGQRWFHLYPGQGVKAGDTLHWTGPSQNWNFMCAECHSTNLRKNFDSESGQFRTTWSEINVSCEACHGPGSRHVAWARDRGASRAAGDKGLVLALDERKGATWTPVASTGTAMRSVPRTSAREIEMCARCHARAARLTDEYVHGKPPLDTHRLSFIDEGLYYDDGQMRDEVYNWGSFVQSRMYARGVTCSDCHEPHALKLRKTGNAVCTQCHEPAKYDAPAHTHHASGSTGASCAACHMPTTTYMVVDPRHDHSLRVPRPDLSVKYGTPNACNTCHAKRSPQWAAAAIEQWTGRPPAGFQAFADALRAGSTGAPDARGKLLTIVENRSQPALVRASALRRLGDAISPAHLDLVSRALNDADPLVRLAAVEALAPADPGVRARYLARMTADAVRSVRIEAARALAGPAENTIPAAERSNFTKALDEFIAVQRYNADRPEGHMNLGGLYMARGDSDRAAAEYEKALAIDPTFVAAYVNLADVYRAKGDDDSAEASLRRGLAREPEAAALHHALGLSLVRQKKRPDALKALASAAKLDPASARYAYVYAVALHDTGSAKEAVAVLEAARKRTPYDRNVLTALAHYALESGNRDAARAYVRELRELEPDEPAYARLAAQIEGRAGR
jgi:predicted CXXCH cytochrome family protein